MYRVAGVLGVFAAVVASAGAATTRPAVTVTGAAAWSPSRPEIAFAASVGGRQGIAVARADGSGLRFLTPSADPDPRVSTSIDPIWSPGGNLIAFSGVSASDSSTFLRVIGRDGSGLRTLAAGGLPSWAPDGGRLAFETFDPTLSPAGVAIVDLRGRQRPLTPWVTSTPEWQPHGTLIAFSAGVAGSVPGTSHQAVFVLRSDGSGRRRLATGDGPVWSSDGRLLAYANNGSVEVIHPDGSGRRRIAGVPTGDAMAWAPGRMLLAVLRGEGPYGRRGGYVVDLASGHVRRVLGPTPATQAVGPAWSRDGQTLAFVTYANKRIYVVGADGRGGHFLDLR